MDYLLELATLLLRQVRDESTRRAAADTPALDALRRHWQHALQSPLGGAQPSAIARAAVAGSEPPGDAMKSAASAADDDGEELRRRAPDVLAVETLAEVLSHHPELISDALQQAGVTTYPTFLEYLVRTVDEFATPGRSFSLWKWLSANEHVNLLSDRREAVARILITTASWQAVAPDPGRTDAGDSGPVGPGDSTGGVTASMFGAGELRERANQLKDQCVGAAHYVLLAAGLQAQEWHAVGRLMRVPAQRTRFLAALRRELLARPDLVRNLTEATAAAVPFTMAFAAELAEIHESRRARGAPDSRTPLHPLRQAAAMDLVGLALSGGGVRSATFNLGVLQALAHLGLLTRVDYLSTVSGGGYIGAWLASWSKRLRDQGARGIVAVEARLRDEPVTEPDAPRMRALRFLREYSNYLTPQAGFFSADTWTMVAIWLRNTLLNQTVLGLALCAMLAVPWLLWYLQCRLTESTLPPGTAVGAACPSGLFAQSPVPMVSMTMLLLYAAAVSGFQLRRFWLSPTERLRVSKDMLGQLGVLFEILTPVVAAAALLSTTLFEAIGCATDAAFASMARRDLTLVFFGVSGVVAIGGHYAKCFFADRVRTTLGPVRWFVLGFYGVFVVTVALVAESVAGAAAIVAGLQGVASLMMPMAALSYLFVTFGPPAIIAVLALMIVLKIGILGRNLFDEHREWWSRLGAWLIIVSLGWLGLCTMAFYSPALAAYARLAGWPRSLPLATVVWVAWTTAGVLLAKGPESSGDGRVDPSRWLREWIVVVAPYVFVVGLLMLVAMVTFRAVTDFPITEFGPNAVYEPHWGDGQHWHWLLALPPGLLLLAFVLSWRVDVNEFSMHHFYKNRLVRCYLGASRDERMSALERAPDPFTGFDSSDDLKVAYLRYTPGGNSQQTRDAKRDDNRQDVWRYIGPLPIINAALNLVKGDDLAWQERKAQAFAFTPFFSGYDYRHRGSVDDRHAPFGFRPTSLYGYPPFGIGLGTAMAISGAAANPNMGHQSSPPTAFLMTMFNARLGWWMGNPRDKFNWLRSSPRRGLIYLLNELFSLTNDRTHFVNLSDGGHFENLGIYELIRRRCRYIIACDAEQDGALTFSGLGNAIRKCRIDFGAEISVRATRIRPPEATAPSALHCVVGDITYANGDRGTLLYLKASVTGDEPADILEYQSREPAFPHHSTMGDQFFDESQFESYRKLGFHVAHTALAQPLASLRGRGVTGHPELSVLFQRLREYWYPPSAAQDAQRREHTDKYDALLERIMSTTDFDFIDAAFFAPPPTSSPDRQQVFIGALMLDLMERVVLDLELDGDRDHPHNAGWLAIFQRWKQHTAVATAWSASRGSYSRKFQWFYESL